MFYTKVLKVVGLDELLFSVVEPAREDNPAQAAERKARANMVAVDAQNLLDVPTNPLRKQKGVVHAAFSDGNQTQALEQATILAIRIQGVASLYLVQHIYLNPSIAARRFKDRLDTSRRPLSLPQRVIEYYPCARYETKAYSSQKGQTAIDSWQTSLLKIRRTRTFFQRHPATLLANSRNRVSLATS